MFEYITESVGCGWCYNSDNPLEGTCTPGSFTNSDHGTCNIINTSQIENSTSSSIGKNRSMTDPSSLDTSFAWAYEECPDIDECKLNIHKCHSKATCKNVPGSYLCSCNKGFAGDGFNECRRSCLETCERGFCSGEPHFQCKCNLGWTGPACDIDCGCSFHSTCSQGVGFCDQCLNYTSGATCQFCESGTYGDAVSSSGCTPCHCNGHEDRNKGICDPKTGICFCKAKFHGDRCEKCAEGYSGEPVNGGDCHHDCFAKSVIIGEQQGIIGVVNSTGGLRDCLWIVSSNPGFSLDPHTLKQGLDGDPIPVSLSLFKSRIDVNCEDNNVYIYDGLPPAVSTINNSRLLAVLCSDNTAEEVVMVAESGLISVVYSEKPGSRGFNASFRIESCGCHGEPDCDCEKKVKKDSVCHNNCTQNQGICDSRTGRCRCNLGFMEDDCSQRSGLNQLLSSKIELEDSNGILSRIGHSLISDSNGVLWLFGGYHPDRGILQDLRAFDTKTEMFKIVNFQTLEKTSELSSPPPRLFHAACYALESNSLYIHGGMNFNEELSDFWRFDLNDLVWESLTHTIEKRSIDNEKVEISLAGHTLTYIPDSRSILIIGGYSQDTGLNGVVYEYLLQYSTWKRIKTTGFPPTSLFGHTASYIQGMKTLFVFGLVGSSASSDSSQSYLYCLNIDTKVWSVLPFSPKHSKAVYSSGNTISGRMFHSGVETPNSLIFLGADPPNSKLNTILVFWLECLQWVKITAEKQDFKFMRKQTEWIGPDFDSNFGARSVFSQGSIYTIGGVRGIYRTYISRIQLSQDVCNLFSLNQIDCLDITGCNFCNQGNSSVCFSEYRASQVSQETGDLYAREPGDLHAREPGDLKICSQDDIVKGQVCDQNWISQNDRDCKSLSSCGECLVEWPVFGGSPIQSHCQWCHGCDRGGKCVPRGLDCSTENLCYSQQKSIELSGECPELECSATSCTNCLDSNCFWSKQFTRSGKQRVSVGEDGVGWTCQRKSLLHILEKANKTQMVIGETSPPLPCPSPCHALQDCQACLEGGGADAGDEGCVWSVNLGRCLSAVLKPMLCLGGICGKVLKSGDSCPPNCKEMRTCSSCLKQTPCGWCSFTQETVQGIGVCAQVQIGQRKGREEKGREGKRREEKGKDYTGEYVLR
ncbi:multiple epidermal growth factor-like domains protein 8 [Eurytemora carolleeae]|uniref:multiple epidermal growth factor-like domains protein 8 n=1 Tax=Eurytemora carolleeae TaxID=1294199 RepID=UPI000C7833E0|nr:multiple epidermal growth factor-like domains protein 8 [Eurytemora carolleeae]|eukprot:XP_023325822.1 multiple epidermal growth factor-like domains protein 8 [Eurytemora affinis]